MGSPDPHAESDTDGETELDPEAQQPEPAPLLELRDGLPPVVDTEEALDETVAAFARRHRPGGDRRRAGVGLPLLRTRLPRAAAPRGRRHRAGRPDRVRRPDRAPARRSATPSGSCTRPPRTSPASRRWACGRRRLFDTELAGRLLGYPRVGLATLVETVVGRSLRKEHSAVDWSTRPLPEPWLEYAALDVEALVELREALGRRARGVRQGRVGPPGVRAPRDRRAAGTARGPVAPHVGHAPGPRPSRPGRRTRAVGDARRDRHPPRRHARPDHPGLGDRRGRQRDATRQGHPARGPRASAAAARSATPPSGSRRCASRARCPTRSCPRSPRGTTARRRLAPGPTVTRSRRRGWPRPASRSRRSSEEHGVPLENLLTPDYVRRVMWEPPVAEDGDELRTGEAVAARLAELGARPWQVELTREALTQRDPDGPGRAASRAAGRFPGRA